MPTASGSFSRPELDDAQTVLYEIDLLRFAKDRLLNPPTAHTKGDEWICLEDFLLHYRNLIEFFGKPKKDFRRGDLSIHRPDNIWPVRVPSAADLALMNVPDLWENYDSADNSLSISKYLQHCTEQRVVGRPPWKVAVMYEELRPAIERFESLLPEYKPATTLTRVRGNGVPLLDGNSTASTRVLDSELIPDRYR